MHCLSAPRRGLGQCSDGAGAPLMQAQFGLCGPLIRTPDKRHYLAFANPGPIGPHEAEAMDIRVTRAFSVPKAWTLTDLLGRPFGRIAEAPGGQVFIDPNERGHSLMPKANL